MFIHCVTLMTPKRRYTFWINVAEAEGLRRVKDAEGIAESEQIRQAIRDYLRQKGVTRRTADRQRARKARRRP